MQTVGISATNAAKSIGSLPHDRPLGPTLAQSDSAGRPDINQMDRHLRKSPSSCFRARNVLAKGYMRALSHEQNNSWKQTPARGLRESPMRSSPSPLGNLHAARRNESLTRAGPLERHPADHPLEFTRPGRPGGKIHDRRSSHLSRACPLPENYFGPKFFEP